MKSKTVPPGEPHRRFASPDGRLLFVLKGVKAGVHVERHEIRGDIEGQGFVLFEAVFTSREAFQHFYDSDAQRFDYPLLYDLVRREFGRLNDAPGV